jgi:ZIP family zinc transporter
MLAAFGWGLLAASSLLLGGVIALRWSVRDETLGMVMAFGSGVLISAVAFELVQEAFEIGGGSGRVGAGLALGSVVFFAGDALIDRRGGRDRKHSGGKQLDGSTLAIVLGILLDGVPESLVLGLTIVVSGTVSAAFVLAVALSNIPEAIAATSGLVKAGWRARSVLGLWALVAAVSGLAAVVGFSTLDTASPGTVAGVLAFAGGAILTMLADTMMPEAFQHGGKVVGLLTTLGFGLAFGVSALQ